MNDVETWAQVGQWLVISLGVIALSGFSFGWGYFTKDDNELFPFGFMMWIGVAFAAVISIGVAVGLR